MHLTYPCIKHSDRHRIPIKTALPLVWEGQTRGNSLALSPNWIYLGKVAWLARSVLQDLTLRYESSNHACRLVVPQPWHRSQRWDC
jgi:hypothetical protein